ncbi:MAG: thiamine-phosphate kinase [Bacteroidia bacterium]
MSEHPAAGLTGVGSLGEFGLIERITAQFPLRHPSVLKAVGDDAAVYRPDPGMAQVVTTDMLLEGIHFDLAYVPLRHLGYKAVVVNLSDLAAMYARPLGITVSIGFSSRFPVEAIDELYAGIHLACERYGVDLLGGDTVSSRQGLIISVTAIGQVAEEDAVYRSGAMPRDLICVSGDLGAAYAGLLVLEREKSAFLNSPDLQPDLSDYDYVAGRQLKPEARFDITDKLRALDIHPTSMMDISDGVASELHHICRQSHCGATIYEDKLPIDFQTMKVSEEFQIAPATFALNGGEDYELLFTVPVQAFNLLQGVPEIMVIGHTTEDVGLIQMVLGSGDVVDVQAQGWQHFR